MHTSKRKNKPKAPSPADHARPTENHSAADAADAAAIRAAMSLENILRGSQRYLTRFDARHPGIVERIPLDDDGKPILHLAKVYTLKKFLCS